MAATRATRVAAVHRIVNRGRVGPGNRYNNFAGVITGRSRNLGARRETGCPANPFARPASSS